MGQYYADQLIEFTRTGRGIGKASGIILESALWQLCRHRHSCHWTRHPSRLARDFGRKAWGDQAYAQEELVAELGSAFLCADLELTPAVRDDHAAYIASLCCEPHKEDYVVDVFMWPSFEQIR